MATSHRGRICILSSLCSLRQSGRVAAPSTTYQAGHKTLRSCQTDVDLLCTDTDGSAKSSRWWQLSGINTTLTATFPRTEECAYSTDQWPHSKTALSRRAEPIRKRAHAARHVPCFLHLGHPPGRSCICSSGQQRVMLSLEAREQTVLLLCRHNVEVPTRNIQNSLPLKAKMTSCRE